LKNVRKKMNLLREVKPLFDFEIVVDVADENERAIESDGAQHDEEIVAEHQHVSEVERGLKNTGHFGTIEIIEKGIGIDEDSGRTST